MLILHPAKRRTSWRWAISAAVLAALLCSRAAGADVQIQTIAVTGQPAPDGNGALSRFDVARLQLNNTGQVAFGARLTGTSGGNADNGGFFLADGGTVTPVSRFPAPGFRGYLLNDSGEVAFDAWGDSVYPPGTENLWAVFRYDGQTLTKIVRVGQPLPGGGGTFPEPFVAGLNDTGQVVFSACSNFCTYYLSDGHAITRIVGEGDPLPDGNGTILTPNVVRLNNAGQVVFQSLIQGSNLPPGIPTDGRILLYDGGVLSQIARSGQPAPDGDGVFANVSFFGQQYDDWFNDLGQVLLQAEIIDASSGPTRIYRSDGSVLTEIARSGQPAPDGNGNFTGFFEPVLFRSEGALNNAGQVAFFATLPGNVTPFVSNHGLYLSDGNNLIQIVRTGQPAPDGNGTVITAVGQALNDAGHVAFKLCTLDNCGIFLFDGNDLIEVVREGDLIDIGGGDIRAIRSFATDPLLNNHGQVAFTANFGIGAQQGVFLATISTTLPGDYNRDGTVNAADYVLWRKNSGTQDGYNTWRANFGATANGAAAVAQSQSPTPTPIPEPASTLLALLAIALATLIGYRHR